MTRSAYLITFVTLLFFEPVVARSQPVGNPIPKQLSLPQAENLLIQRNYAVIAARYQVEASRAQRLIASYKPNPIVTVGMEQVPVYSPIQDSFPRFFKTNPDAGANPVYTLRFDQPWERGGKRELRTAVADSDLKASEALMLNTIRTQLFQLRTAFATAALARDNLRFAESAEQQYAQTEMLTQVKVEQGDIAKVETYRVSAGRLQYQQAVLQARTSYDQAIRDVLNLLGASEQDISRPFAQTASVQPVALSSSDSTASAESQTPDSLRAEPIEVVASLDDRPILQAVAELRTMALANRPDVIAARNQLASATTGTRLAGAQRIRDVDAGYEYQRVGNDHSLGFVMQFPVFVHNNQQALLPQAQALENAAEAQLRQAEFQAVTDVEKAYQSYVSSRKVLDLYSAATLSQIEKLQSIAALSYREGAESLFEYLDAQRAHNAAMTAYNQARFDYQMALWQLEQATGSSLR
jgi:cobalt-zinc-cadmium efflux system outer membrane protein